MAEKTLLTTYDNNDKAVTVILKDSDGNFIDISNYTFWFTVRRYNEQNDSVIQKTKTSHNGSNDDAVNGKTVFDVTQSDNNIATGDYIFDVQTKDTSGNITTQAVGTYRVLARVTDEVSA